MKPTRETQNEQTPRSTMTDSMLTVIRKRCGYCCQPSEGCRLAYLMPTTRPKDRYEYPTILCPDCRKYLRGRFAYSPARKDVREAGKLRRMERRASYPK